MSGGTVVIFEVKTSSLGERIQLVTPVGELDYATAAELRERIEELIDDQSTKIILDLDRVGLLDSTALMVLLTLQRRLSELGGELRVVCTNHHILRVFRITGLDRLLRPRPSLRDAVETEHARGFPCEGDRTGDLRFVWQAV